MEVAAWAFRATAGSSCRWHRSCTNRQRGAYPKCQYGHQDLDKCLHVRNHMETITAPANYFKFDVGHPSQCCQVTSDDPRRAEGMEGPIFDEVSDGIDP
jgi:hypothetical protein